MAHRLLKQHFPYAALALTAVSLGVGDGTLAILVIAGCIGLLPAVYGADVDQIAHAARERNPPPRR